MQCCQPRRFAQETQPQSQSQCQLGQAQTSPGPKVHKFSRRGPGKRTWRDAPTWGKSLRTLSAVVMWQLRRGVGCVGRGDRTPGAVAVWLDLQPRLRKSPRVHPLFLWSCHFIMSLIYPESHGWLWLIVLSSAPRRT